MTVEDLEETVREFRAKFPESECLVRILVPVGYTQRLCDYLKPTLVGYKGGHNMTATLYGVPIEEKEEMMPDEPPKGEFADGSIRWLLPQGGGAGK